LPYEVRRALSPHVCEHRGAQACKRLARHAHVCEHRGVHARRASHAARKRRFNQHALERWGTYQKSIKTL
jgi:hypothetical protein